MKTLLLLLLSSLITFTLYADAPVKKTGQGQCFDTSTNAVTECYNTTGQDGNYQKGLENHYESDGATVTDTTTGLTWQDYGLDENLTWSEAIAYCPSLGTGIRLPTRKELKSIVHYGKECPAIDPIFKKITFDCTSYDEYYWTVDELDVNNAYTIRFGGGFDAPRSKLEKNHVRCVKGDTFTPSTYTRDDATETVYDAQANLTWQDNSDVNDGTKRKSWADALSYCEDLNHGGLSYWRLPNINELYMLMDFSEATFINSAFEYKPNSYYWSSTTLASSSDDYYRGWVAFYPYSGGIEDFVISKSSTSQVRCVRDGKIGTPSKFPGPKIYDSGWIAVSAGDHLFEHDLGPKVYDALIQVSTSGPGNYITNAEYGGYDFAGEYGYFWHGLTENNITVHKRVNEEDTHFRVQIWQPPTPDFDSNWLEFPIGDTGPLPHLVGGNPDNYVIDMQFSWFGFPPHNIGYGGISLNNGEEAGAYWHSLSSNTIHLTRLPNDIFATLFRGRIWNVSQSSYDSGWNAPSHNHSTTYQTYHPKPADMNNTFIYLDQRSSASGINHKSFGLNFSAAGQEGTYWFIGNSVFARKEMQLKWSYPFIGPDEARLRYFESKSQMGINPSIIMYLLN